VELDGAIHLLSSSHLATNYWRAVLIILGIALLLIGLLTKIAVVWYVGLIVLVIGLILVVLSALGHAIGGRRHYF
jgi:membrane-bound ClpP family serine protease